MLDFGVTMKMLTPCLRVLHVMWGAWRVDYPWVYHDGQTHWVVP
jgi:hypothetical protein